MKANRWPGDSLKKTILTAVAVIGTSTMLFQGFTLAVTEAEFKKTKTIPTSYATANLPPAAPNSVPEGYTKANYTVGAINNEYYRNQMPTSKDMTKEDAAEIGAQALWEIFDLNLEGQVIEMGYQQASENTPRSYWYANVLINGETYIFTMDSVTGELLTMTRGRALVEKVPKVDAALDKNPQEYVELAKKLAEKKNVVHSKVKSVGYNGQSYNSNGNGGFDPIISVVITGENGEAALMDFSRYDKALVSIVFNEQYKIWNAPQEEASPSTDEQILVIIDQSPKPGSGNSFDFSVKQLPEGYSLAQMQWISKENLLVDSFQDAVKRGGTGEEGFYISGNGQFAGFIYRDTMKGETGKVVLRFMNAEGKDLDWKKEITLK